MSWLKIVIFQSLTHSRYHRLAPKHLYIFTPSTSNTLCFRNYLAPLQLSGTIMPIGWSVFSYTLLSHPCESRQLHSLLAQPQRQANCFPLGLCDGLLVASEIRWESLSVHYPPYGYPQPVFGLANHTRDDTSQSHATSRTDGPARHRDHTMTV